MDYKNFIQDFPIRCGEILEKYREQDRKNGREVTHMFAIAAAAIPIPFARLSENEHPSPDKKKYEQAVGKFTNLCDQYFLGSCLWEDKDEARSWKSGQVSKEDVKEGPEYWRIRDCSSLTGDIKVKEILKIIRNALAHGSIFTRPNKETDQIEKIILLSKILVERKINGNVKRIFNGNYDTLTVSPEDFFEFLVNWVSFLRDELKIPPEPD